MNTYLSALSKKFKQYPILFVCGLLLPVGVILLVMRLPILESAQAGLDEKEKKWGEIQSNLERSRNLTQHVDLVTEYSEELNKRLMVEDRVARNYEFFYRLERESSVELTKVEQKAPVENATKPEYLPKIEKFKVIPYEVVISGEYRNIIHFIENIESQDFIIRVESVSIGTLSTDLARNALSAKIDCFILGELK